MLSSEGEGWNSLLKFFPTVLLFVLFSLFLLNWCIFFPFFFLCIFCSNHVLCRAQASLPGFQVLPLQQFGNWGPEITTKFDPEKDTYLMVSTHFTYLFIYFWVNWWRRFSFLMKRKVWHLVINKKICLCLKITCIIRIWICFFLHIRACNIFIHTFHAATFLKVRFSLH